MRKRVKRVRERRGLSADTFFRQVFLGEGTVPLTDELIAELVIAGWDRGQLLKWRAAGYVYSQPRGTVLSPIEHG
jgi:hypothetical protein